MRAATASMVVERAAPCKTQTSARCRTAAERALRLGQPTVTALVTRLKANAGEITFLDLSRNASFSMKPTAATRAFANVLSKDQFVKTLVLRECGLGDAAAVAISDLLRSNHTIEEIDLQGNQLTAAGVMSIAKGLAVNRGLRTLNMLNQSRVFDEECAEEYRLVFDTNITLTRVLWELTPCGSAQALSQMITRNNEIWHRMVSGLPYAHLLPECFRCDGKRFSSLSPRARESPLEEIARSVTSASSQPGRLSASLSWLETLSVTTPTAQPGKLSASLSWLEKAEHKGPLESRDRPRVTLLQRPLESSARQSAPALDLKPRKLQVCEGSRLNRLAAQAAEVTGASLLSEPGPSLLADARAASLVGAEWQSDAESAGASLLSEAGPPLADAVTGASLMTEASGWQSAAEAGAGVLGGASLLSEAGASLLTEATGASLMTEADWQSDAESGPVASSTCVESASQPSPRPAVSLHSKQEPVRAEPELRTTTVSVRATLAVTREELQVFPVPSSTTGSRLRRLLRRQLGQTREHRYCVWKIQRDRGPELGDGDIIGDEEEEVRVQVMLACWLPPGCYRGKFVDVGVARRPPSFSSRLASGLTTGGNTSGTQYILKVEEEGIFRLRRAVHGGSLKPLSCAAGRIVCSGSRSLELKFDKDIGEDMSVFFGKNHSVTLSAFCQLASGKAPKHQEIAMLLCE